jgi:DAK2 domain fusion protein YloV
MEEELITQLDPDAGSVRQAAAGVDQPGCDGHAFVAALEAGLTWLENHAEAINVLNVFPVPDGDTGTNMVLTLRTAVAEAKRGTSLDEIAALAARGALMGARGNSGVILSQLLRGFAQALSGQKRLTARLLAEAFAAARDFAYQAVMRPVEGTILTVAKEVAAATALACRQENVDLRQVISVAKDAARHAVAATPSLLPLLAEAGVVDAGGQGLFCIIEGVWRHLHGMLVEPNGALIGEAHVAAVGSDGEYGYDTQFLIHGEGLDVDAIRDALSQMGESLLVVGDSTTVKVHIHTHRPGDPLNYAVSIGSVSDVVVENMQAQYQQFLRQSRPPERAQPTKPIGIVAVAIGDGLKRVLDSLGCDAVVHGGQTMNPSVEELLEAIDSLPQEQVLLLPNNGNVIMAAQHAAKLATKQVLVVPTRTIPQGISALLAYNYELGLEENLANMAEAARAVRTIELTLSTRAAKLGNVRVRQGDFIALLDEELVAAGSNPSRVLLAALNRAEARNGEVATIYRGAEATPELLSSVMSVFAKHFPHLEVEVVEGGQPHYHFIIAVE